MKYFSALSVCGLFLAGSGGTAFGGGMDLAGQPIGVIFEEGRHLSVSLASIRPSVSGTINLPGAQTTIAATQNTPATTIPTPLGASEDSGSVVPNNNLLTINYKDDISEDLSYGIIVDEPFGRAVSYKQGALKGTEADIGTQAFTGVLRYRTNENFSFYGGVRQQRTGGYVKAGSIGNGQKIELKDSWGTGFLVGGAYEIPEYKVRIAVTFNGKVDHSIEINQAGAPLGAGQVIAKGTVETSTPSSINIDFQAPVSRSTLILGGIRDAKWSQTKAVIPIKTVLGDMKTPDLLGYSDARSYRLGVAHRLNENWVLAGSYSVEPATKKPITGAFGLTDGSNALSLGARYTSGDTNYSFGVVRTTLGDNSGSFTITAPDALNQNPNITLTPGSTTRIPVSFKGNTSTTLAFGVSWRL